MEMTVQERKKDGRTAVPHPGGPGRGGIQEGGWDQRSQRGKEGQEDKTEKCAPVLGVRALGTFQKAD